MVARAVLIGSETYGLTGCDADVALIDELLHRRGFRTRRLVGPQAARRTILETLDELIADTAPGDTAVVYYSGHGGRLERPDAAERKAAGRSTHLQFLVPTDMEQSSPSDFRGILAEELAVVQRRLVDAFDGRPVDATTILDCCHSGYMARDATARSRSVDLRHRESRMFTIRGILDHLASLGPDAEVAAGATVPEVVRLTACQTEQSAYELPSERGGTYGAFTDALVTVLDEIGEAPVPWGTVGELVRRRVRSKLPEQRPEIEGPLRRAVFGSATLDELALPLVVVDGRLWIEAAALLGLEVDDTIRVVTPGADRIDVEATVVEISDGRAALDVDAAFLDQAASAVAIPARISVPAVRVAVGDGDDRGRFVEAIARRPRLTVDDTDPIARLESDGTGRWRITDAAASPWRVSHHAPDDAGVADLLDELEAIAVGQRLLDLAGGRGPHELADDVDIAFGAADDGTRTRLDTHGARIVVGTHVTLTIRNTAATERFVWVFDVGVSGRSALVTAANPSGLRLGPSGEADDTLEVWGADGEPLVWPTDVPEHPDGRPETFVVVTADRRNDLGALSSRGEHALRSPLDLVLDEVRIGRRDAAAVAEAGRDPLRYHLDHVEFVLLPGD